MVNTTVAFLTVHASRSKAAFEVLVARWVGTLVSESYGAYQQWVHGRQTCLAHLIRRARGLAKRKNSELAWFGRRVLAELQQLVHWAQAPPTARAVQIWYARMVQLIGRSRYRQDEAGKLARTLNREMDALWTFVAEQGSIPRITGPREHSGSRCSGAG
jgi:transposase